VRVLFLKSMTSFAMSKDFFAFVVFLQENDTTLVN
jgi:hypothetical protein